MFHKFTEPLAIVRDLANQPAPLDSEWGHCELCISHPQRDAFALIDHEVTCPWRRAREYMIRYGREDTP